MYGEHTLLITYDLRKPGRNYDALYEEIKSAPKWAHPVESVWFVRSPNDANSWHAKLKAKLDANDALLVLDLDTGYWVASGLSDKLVDWMRTNLKIKAGF